MRNTLDADLVGDAGASEGVGIIGISGDYQLYVVFLTFGGFASGRALEWV